MGTIKLIEFINYKGLDMFKKGDIVEITEFADATSMLDLIKGKGYEVIDSAGAYRQCIQIEDESGRCYWYNATYFKLKEKEERVNKFKIGDKVVPSTDPVIGIHEKLTTGCVYEVIGVNGEHIDITGNLKEDNGKDWHVDWFELYKENKSNMNTPVETDFRVGQTVYDAAYGKGKVVEVKTSGSFPVGVEFESSRDGVGYFTADGKVLPESQRTLFFSPPTVSGATKPVFVPTFKQGDVLFAYGKQDGDMRRIIVSIEDENAVWDEYSIGWLKSNWEFYKLGEKIEFN